MIEFNNGRLILTISYSGSRIEPVETSTDSTTRGKRSEYVSFYCDLCQEVHMDYPIDNMVYINDLCYHYTWLKIALDNFVENPSLTHCIKGDMTMHEFIQKYSTEEVNTLLRMYVKCDKDKEGEKI